MYYRILICLVVVVCALTPRFSATPQTTLMNDTFDDGSLTRNPRWSAYFNAERITIDSSLSFSPPASCRIATSNEKAAIEAGTRIFNTALPFEIEMRVYVVSMGDEAIPMLLRGQNTVLALFLLPNGLVQLDVLKSRTEWITAQLRVPGGYSLHRWLSFKVSFDGRDSVTLFIDGVCRGHIVQPLVYPPMIYQLGNRYLAHTSTFYVDDLIVRTPITLPPPGKLLLILCSDTGTWDGLDVSQRSIFLRYGLYQDPNGNAARVINTTFRGRIRDSFGNPLEFTWFMLDGSMVASNRNPENRFPWISNLEMIERYHGDQLRAVGDEIGFHYHNWVWNDPDRNGVYHWNQSENLTEYRNDFVESLGHVVVEGNRMPTSFRSGWHYMENEWEALIDSLIPYRFENTSPGRGTDTLEPLDNNYDWSRAPQEWTPYHPAQHDYQSHGGLKGWESRCMYMKPATSDRILDPFMRAYLGNDQIVTIWSHLPESDFPQQIIAIDSVIHWVGEDYPEVSYEYVTATEAMKRWRGTSDDVPPRITVAVQNEGDSTVATIRLSEPLWQPNLLVFAKDSAGRVFQLSARALSPLSWDATFHHVQTPYVSLGVAATDTAGNSSVEVVNFGSSGLAVEKGDIPSVFVLHQPYPNPFNATTHIAFELPERTNIELSIFNALGQRLSTLVSAIINPGKHLVSWDASRLSSGVYFCHLTTGRSTRVARALLLR